MPRPRLTWTETLEGESRSLCDDEMAILNDIANGVGKIRSWDSEGEKSFASHFREEFRNGLTENWLRDFLLLPLNRRRSSVINYAVDAALNVPESKCGHKHQIRLEISFDNRQIIGTNVLKMIVGTTGEEWDESQRFLGIIIAPSKEAKAVFGLDSAVASSDEYLLAIETGYSAILSNPFYIGVVREG